MPPRRDFLKALSALGLCALPLPVRADHAGQAPSTIPAVTGDTCGAGAQALFVPGSSGLFGRLVPAGAALKLRAAPAGGKNGGPWSLAYTIDHAGKRFINPTLVLRPGERLRIELDNALSEPTIVHWHGLAVDTRNDGGGVTLAAPGERYAYDFEVRDRASLYWYHPHPHGLTAGQAYRGLFGMIEVEGDDERALRAALDLVPGKSEIALLLQDRRASADYAAGEADLMHGLLGDTVLINGSACPYLDVGTRIYRFRVLNASNARTYRLGWRSVDRKPVSFMLIGTDGGLLATPQRCEEVFVAAAERVDMLLDLSDARAGDTLWLETRAFDPMHIELPAGAAGAVDHAAMVHGAPADAPPSTAGGERDAHAEHRGAFAEGAPRTLLELRVRERMEYRARVPATLAKIAAIDVRDARERPLRLGFAKGRWRINDRVFAMGETPIEVKRNTVETWLIRNYFNSMPHAMHLHGFHFQVLARETSPDQLAALKIDDRGRLATDLGWRDTVLVWPGETVRIAVDFALPDGSAFAGPQTYMFHCHNLEHEDGGMMLGVKVA